MNFIFYQKLLKVLFGVKYVVKFVFEKRKEKKGAN